MVALSGGSGRSDMGWRAVMAEMLAGVRAAVARFPVTTVFLLAATIWANLLVAEIYLLSGADGRGSESHVIALMCAALAALAVSVAGEARGRGERVRAGAALAAGLAVAVVMGMPRSFQVLEWTMAPAFIGLVLVAPFIGRGGSGAFWMFCARAAFAALLGILALLLIAGGVSAILASLTYLFGLPVPDELYAHVWTFTALFAAPLFALGQLTERFDEEPGAIASGFMDHGMRALGDFLAAPLLILYALILHLYALKIVVTGEVPQGQIGWLVLTYGVCVFAALIIINPFFDRARAPTRFFLRLWPFFLPIPLVLLFYALALRVGTFGFTPERYLLGLFGVVATLVLLVQLFPRLRGDIRIVAALPVFALILGSFGPQGAVGISVRSQASRFLEIVQNPPVDGNRHEEGLGALSFLSHHDATSRVAPEGTVVKAGEDNGYRAIAKAWGLDPDRPRPGLRGLMLNDNSTPLAIAVEGFDIVVQGVSLTVGAREPVVVRLPSGQEVRFRLEPDAVAVTMGEETVRFAFETARVEEMVRRRENAPVRIPLDAGSRRLALVPSYLYADEGEPPRLQNMDTSILLRAGDWAP